MNEEAAYALMGIADTLRELLGSERPEMKVLYREIAHPRWPDRPAWGQVVVELAYWPGDRPWRGFYLYEEAYAESPEFHDSIFRCYERLDLSGEAAALRVAIRRFDRLADRVIAEQLRLAAERPEGAVAEPDEMAF